MFIFPTTVLTTHVGQGDNEWLSPRLWQHVHGQSSSADGKQNGIFIGDDFANFGGHAPAISGTTTLPSTTVTGPGGYGVFTSTTTTASSITQKAGAANIVRMSAGATIESAVWITSGGGTGNIGTISDASGAKKMIFEARVSLAQIGNNGGAVFVGLAEEGLNAADTKANTGIMKDKDFIGFNTIDADGDSIDFIYRKEGEAQQTVISGVHVPVADTFVKLGFVYNPAWDSAKKIRIFVDNVEQSTYVTGTNIAASTFPDGEFLSFLAGIQNGDTTAAHLDMDWWACYYGN